MTARDVSPLRLELEATGLPLKDVTVLAAQNDPFRVDTPARHRDGAWLANAARDLGLGDRRIHLRGLHYMVLGWPKPDGLPYTNTDPDWLWLAEQCGKAARWLGYMAFDQIVDQRNSPPVVRLFKAKTPTPYLNVGVDVEIPEAAELMPRVGCRDFKGVQPYKLVIFGEKSSLEDVLAPIARDHQCDLYLPTGEISDTLLHHMARVGAADGRPMVVFTFSDCDPAGWQMPISIGRKLQAFKTLLFKELDFEVYRVGLTPDHVREYGLPSTPLKDTERRADRWRDAMDVEQTEIDALASLRPELLRNIARQAIAPFFDSSLDQRVAAAREEWEQEAQAAIDAAIDGPALERIRTEATERLDAMAEEIEHLNEALQLELPEVTLPELVVPDAIATGDHGEPLIDSSWSFPVQCRRLIAQKAYETLSEQ
jgi:hypothetical protein